MLIHYEFFLSRFLFFGGGSGFNFYIRIQMDATAVNGSSYDGIKIGDNRRNTECYGGMEIRVG